MHSTSSQNHSLPTPNIGAPHPDSNKFIADEGLLYAGHRTQKVPVGASPDDVTVKSSNTTEESEAPLDTSRIECVGPLTFDPQHNSEQEAYHVPPADDSRAELMRWHYRLGHLTFPKLKLLAKLGKIPKHLATARPPVSAGCAFGAMTKVPWRGKLLTDTCLLQPNQGSACQWTR